MKTYPPLSFKSGTPKLSAGLAAILLSFGFLAPARAQTRFNSQPVGTSVKIDGTSTMHAWEMEGTTIAGFIEFGQGIKLEAAQTTIPGLKDGKVPVKVHAHISVTSIHAKVDHLPEVMDGLMQKALLAEQHSRIEYSLTEMTFKEPHAPGTPFAFDTTGDLSIAGVTNKVSFPVSIESLDADRIKVNATVPLKMTAFHVDPPAPNIGAGLMRCGDDVKIIIDWTLKERKTEH
ncbi:MAG: YceI family protein [Verrucomicrobiota bacterium]